MPVTQTSKDALKYLKNKYKIETQIKRIMAVVECAKEPLTRREIAIRATLETGAVAGRVAWLIEKGILVDLPKRKCSITEIKVKTVDLAKRHTRPEEYLL